MISQNVKKDAPSLQNGNPEKPKGPAADGVALKYKFSICLWESPKTHHFFDFGIFGQVSEPQTHLSL